MPAADLYTATVIPITASLRALSGMLEKAQAHIAAFATERRPASYFESILLGQTIIFDQFPLVRQVQVATDNAKNGVARIAGIDAPKMEDTETTIDELLARILKTIEFLDTIQPEQFEGRGHVHAVLPYHADKYLDMTDYALHYLMPNFYFHVTSAYTILRKNGVTLGKGDFLKDLPWKTA